MSFMDADLEQCKHDFVATYQQRPATRYKAGLVGDIISSNDDVNDSKNFARSDGLIMARERPRVAVVGAGLAGLRCVQVLLQKGFDVTLYEARDQVGGRVCPYSVHYSIHVCSLLRFLRFVKKTSREPLSI